MKRLLVYFVFFGVCFLFCNCKKIEKKETNKFVDEWYAMNGRLVIYKDGTFDYVRFTCLSKSISNGRWSILNDTLILNSQPSDDCYTQEDFIIQSPDKNKIKEPIKDCALGKAYVNFKAEKFYLKDSLLMSVSSPFEYNKEISETYNFRKTTYYPRS